MINDILDKVITKIMGWLNEDEVVADVFISLDRDAIFSIQNDLKDELDKVLSSSIAVEFKKLTLKSIILKLLPITKMLYEYEWYLASLNTYQAFSAKSHNMGDVTTEDEYSHLTQWEMNIIAANAYYISIVEIVEQASILIGFPISILSQEIGLPADTFVHKIEIDLESLKLRFPKSEYIGVNPISEGNNGLPIDVNKSELEGNAPEQNNLKDNDIIQSIKPVFKPEQIDKIFDLIKDFFYIKQQGELKNLLLTGDDAPSHLLFLASGNRLADTFKQLIKSDVITGCIQKELEEWIFRNFKYRFRKSFRNYKQRYLNDLISSTKDTCPNPIIDIKIDRQTGEVLIVKA